MINWVANDKIHIIWKRSKLYLCLHENSIQKADEALQNGEGLGGIKEEAAEAGPVKDNDGTEKTKQKSSVKKKNTIPVPAADLNFCLTKTNLDKPKIAQWWKLVQKYLI